jgi:hypothetical protein
MKYKFLIVPVLMLCWEVVSRVSHCYRRRLRAVPPVENSWTRLVGVLDELEKELD